MTVSIEMLKEFIGSIACKADVGVLEHFIIWLDIKVCEYKLTGKISWGENEHNRCIE